MIHSTVCGEKGIIKNQHFLTYIGIEMDINVTSTHGNSTNRTIVPANQMVIHIIIFTQGTIFSVGMIGNCIVVAVYILSPLLRKAQNMFLVNLAIIDIIILIFMFPIALVNSYVGRGWNLRHNQTLCDVAAFFANVVWSISVIAMTNIALNRYITISRPMASKGYFTGPKCLLYIVLSWVYSIIINIMPVFGWGRMVFVQSLLFCTFDPHSSFSYNVFGIFTGYLLPSVVTVFCYVGIFLKVRGSRRQVAAHQGTEVEGVDKVELQLAVQMFIILAVFYITWGPYMVVLRMSTAKVSVLTQILLTGIMSINSIVNPFVYVHYNKLFRKELCRHFRCQCFKGNGRLATGSSRIDGSSTTANGTI